MLHFPGGGGLQAVFFSFFLTVLISFKFNAGV